MTRHSCRSGRPKGGLVGADVDADHLADLVIVEAGQYGDSERVLVLLDDARRVPERHSERRLIQDQIVQDQVADLGDVRPVQLIVEKSQGIRLRDRVHPLVVVVQLLLEENVADDALEDALRGGDDHRSL